MASRLLSDLEPEIEGKCRAFLVECQKRGIPAHVTCTARTDREQRALYAQGREPLDGVNALRKACGLWAIKEEENKRPVTWTLESKHIVHFDPVTGEMVGRARAFDVAIVKDKQFVWDLKVDCNAEGTPDYEEIGLIGEALGLKWGGRFKTKDRPHFEI